MLIYGTRVYHCSSKSYANDFVLEDNNFSDELSYSYAARDSPKYEPYQRYLYCLSIFMEVHVLTDEFYFIYNPLYRHIMYICSCILVYIFLNFLLFRKSSSSRSRSRSPEEPKKTKVEFITSFGGESDEEGVVQGPALPPQLNVSESPHTWSVPLNYVYMGIYNCREYK